MARFPSAGKGERRLCVRDCRQGLANHNRIWMLNFLFLSCRYIYSVEYGRVVDTKAGHDDASKSLLLVSNWRKTKTNHGAYQRVGKYLTSGNYGKKRIVLFFSCSSVQYLQHPTRSKQLSTVSILGFQFGLYHVVVPLSFLRSYQHFFIFTFIRDKSPVNLLGFLARLALIINKACCRIV